MVDANPAMVFAFRPERAAYSGPRHRLGNVVDSKSEPYRGGIENYEFRITNYENCCMVHHSVIILNMPIMRLSAKRKDIYSTMADT